MAPQPCAGQSAWFKRSQLAGILQNLVFDAKKLAGAVSAAKLIGCKTTTENTEQ